jgi:DNA-binding LacI/PurR family transcriptional regulator
MGHSFIPIYQKLTAYYKERIISQDYPPGQKIDSINQIMIKHKVSRETAKLVLKQLLDEGLIIMKQGKGSFVVHHVETNNTWGMIIPFYSSNMELLIFHLDLEAQKRGKKFTYFLGYNNPDEEKRLVSKMILEGNEAIIVVPNYDETKTAEFYRNLIQGNTQVILTDYTMSGSYFKYVVQSYDLGVKRALSYLAENHSENLLLMKNETWKGRNLLIELMEQTFSTLVAKDYPDKKVQVLSQMKELSKSFLKENKIKGVLCFSDVDAIKVLGRLKKWNISVPAEVKLVNYGNTELTTLYEPEISVIDCLYEEMAIKTASLIDSGKESGPYEQHIIQPKLIIRGT